MNFGPWVSLIHTDSEQVKRIESAKKANTSPSTVDKIYMTAVFQGSGNIPYQTTLDTCTCVDFSKRKLPCKHMYRLAMELGLIEGNFISGRNKNAISEDLIALPESAKMLLHDICYLNIYAQQPYSTYKRDNVCDALISSGFCKEIPVSLVVIDAFPVSTIKEFLFSSPIDGLPKRTSIKRTFLKWLADNESYAFPLLNNCYCFLMLTEQAEQAKSTIYRRLSKILYPSAAIEEDNIIFTIKI